MSSKSLGTPKEKTEPARLSSSVNTVSRGEGALPVELLLSTRWLFVVHGRLLVAPASQKLLLLWR